MNTEDDAYSTYLFQRWSNAVTIIKDGQEFTIENSEIKEFIKALNECFKVNPDEVK